MTLTPRLQKIVLTAHVTASVGWFGAVASSLALAVAGLTSQDAQMTRAAYLMLELVGLYILVPFALASLLTGLVQSLGTQWGLFRHYWILLKLVITVLSTIALFVHMQPISHMASEVVKTTFLSGDLHQVRVQLVVAAGAALLALLLTTVLSVYKPRGLTPYGWRKQQEEHHRRHEQSTVSQP